MSADDPAAKTESRPSSWFDRRFDVIAVIVLSITAVLTAWCGFEASKWGGEMSIAFSQASSARTQAVDASGEARDARQYDLTIYAEWVRATQAGDDDLVAFIEERFTPEFRTAFDAWNEGGRSQRGPFVMEEYVPPGAERALELSATADAKFAEALENNQRGDDYTLLTVLFALVLFLAAVSQRDITPWARRALLGLAIVVGLTGVAILLTFPVKI